MSPMSEKDNAPESVATTTKMEAQEGPARNLERDQKIRSRAYERYLERGQKAGHDLDDWLQAEHEIDAGSV
jgi:oligoendopeptidase F